MMEGSSNADATLHGINSYRHECIITCLTQLLMGCACDLDTDVYQAWEIALYKLDVQQQLLMFFCTN